MSSRPMCVKNREWPKLPKLSSPGAAVIIANQAFPGNPQGESLWTQQLQQIMGLAGWLGDALTHTFTKICLCKFPGMAGLHSAPHSSAPSFYFRMWHCQHFKPRKISVGNPLLTLFLLLKPVGNVTLVLVGVWIFTYYRV